MSDTLHIVSSSGASQSVDVSVADVWDITLDAACTISLTGASGGVATTVALLLRQDGTGGRTVTWPGSVAWPAGATPTLHAGAAAVTLVTLTTVDGGTTWIGFAEPADGATGAAGTNGVDGVNGGAVSIDYTFSTTTTDSDPGSGNLRLSNATQNAATVIRTDLLDAHGGDWTTVLDSLDDSSNPTVKGHIRLFKKTDPTKYLIFTVTSLAAPSGYRNITVVNVGSSAGSPFANGDLLTLCFERAGDKGDTGAAGTASVGTDGIWDAKGDLAVGTGADTAVRLAVGSNGQAVIADSSQATGLKWVTGSPVKLFDSTLGADTASIDTGAGGFSGAFDILEIWIIAQGDDASPTVDVAFDLTLNNDTGANYDNESMASVGGGAPAAGASVAQTSWAFNTHGQGGTTQYPSVHRITIPGYAQTTFYKVAESETSRQDTTAGNSRIDIRALGWRNTAAITRIKIAARTTKKFKAGSRLVVYGR
jgi:hypothetical protein